jgi:hypothetical protein
MLTKLASRAGFPAALLGAMLLVELGAMHFALTADDDFVYVLGQRINIVCAARARLGIPCPTCGFSRGFVLSLHGRVGEGWRLSPSGPLTAMGMAGFGAVLLLFGAMQWRRMQAQVAAMKRWVARGALVYATGSAVVWMSAWIVAVMRARAHP